MSSRYRVASEDLSPSRSSRQRGKGAPFGGSGLSGSSTGSAHAQQQGGSNISSSRGRAGGGNIRRRSHNQERPLSDFWQELIAADLRLLWATHMSIYNTRVFGYRASYLLDKVVSRNPFKDISLVTWFAALIGCHELGFHYFWPVVANLVVASVLRVFLAAPRPFMYDSKLRPLADRHPSSHGYPSLETHMGVVVWGLLAVEVCHPALWTIAIGMVAFISFTRVYACSRFVHQLVASWVSGIVGIALGFELVNHIKALELMVRHHLFGVALVGVLALALVSLWIESNDSHIARIPKDEYLRVLTDIIESSKQSQDITDDNNGLGLRGEVEGRGEGGDHGTGTGNYNDDSASRDGRDSASDLEGERFRPRHGGGDAEGHDDGVGQGQQPQNHRQLVIQQRRRQWQQRQQQERKDSFHFLSRNLARTTLEKKSIRESVRAAQAKQQRVLQAQREKEREMAMDGPTRMRQQQYSPSR